MRIIMTRRADGNCRLSKQVITHPETGLIYGNDEIIEEKEFDIPDAYLTEGGSIAWNNGPVTDHPDIQKWIKK